MNRTNYKDYIDEEIKQYKLLKNYLIFKDNLIKREELGREIFFISDYFKDIAKGGVKRYLLPNLNAVNYILFDSLDGGGSESLINDAQGKTHGQAILKMEVEVPNECFNE